MDWVVFLTGKGREYVVVLDDAQWTPAPWVNVIANPEFGFLAPPTARASSGLSNAQQNQLTPWCNDPVGDRRPMPLTSAMKIWGCGAQRHCRCASGASVFVVGHRLGYTRSAHSGVGRRAELTQFVRLEDPIKILVEDQ